jgi:hypothetical protein
MEENKNINTELDENVECKKTEVPSALNEINYDPDESIDEYYNKHKDNCDFTKSFSPSEKKAYLLKKYNL